MFPIPDNELSIPQIADYWAREIRPPASPAELQILLEKAWWRGELVGAGVFRLTLLRGFHQICRSEFVFLTDEEPMLLEECSDGGRLVDPRPRVPIPPSPTEAWTDAECAPAYKVIAEDWGGTNISEEVMATFAPMLGAQQLTRDEFLQWIATRGYYRPTFWGNNGDAGSRVVPVSPNAAGAAQVTLRRATTVEIDYAITAVYHDAEADRVKPPNLKELVPLVKSKLRTDYRDATYQRIQECAGTDSHRRRRRPAGRTVASDRRRRDE